MSGSDGGRTRERYRAAFAVLAAYGRAHTGALALGIGGAVGVVVCRLAIPWPLRWALETAAWQPVAFPGADPLLAITLAYLGIAVALGGSEHLQRLHLGRFTAQTVRDLRAAAAHGITRAPTRDAVPLGDATARVIGDSARLRSDLAGIAIHASANGMLFLAVTAIMFAVSPFFGAIFVVSGAIASAIGVVTARRVEPTARRQREKEGRYAEALHAGIENPDEDSAEILQSGSAERKELRTTRLMTRSSWLVHGVLGASVALGLWLGVREVRSGQMVAGELFLFVAYALTVHRRMVQVGRQVARSGKIVASTNRLVALTATRTPWPRPALSPLRNALRVVAGKVPSDRARARISRVALSLEPGSRVAVLGSPGSGKTSLLRLLAGRTSGFKGEIFWDETPVDRDAELLRACVAFLDEKPSFGRRPLWDHLGLPDDADPDPPRKETLRRIDAWQVARRISRSLSTPVASAQLSVGEARALALARILLGDDSSLWVFDSVLEGASRKKAVQRLDEIFRRAAARPVVISMGRAVGLDRFKRVLVLRRGRIVFDGTPGEWRDRPRPS